MDAPDDFKKSVKNLQKKLKEFEKKDGKFKLDFLRNYLQHDKVLTSYVTRKYDPKNFDKMGRMVMDDDEEWLYKQIVEVPFREIFCVLMTRSK